MESARQAVRMFLTTDAEEAARIASELVTLNRERQAAERAIVDEILQRCLEQPVTAGGSRAGVLGRRPASRRGRHRRQPRHSGSGTDRTRFARLGDGRGGTLGRRDALARRTLDRVARNQVDDQDAQRCGDRDREEHPADAGQFASEEDGDDHRQRRKPRPSR